MRHDWRAAIVTGASSGIGAELARELAAAGVAVGLTARRAELLGELAASIRAAGGRAAVAPADVADPAAVTGALHELAGELGPIDLLIAGAGVAVRSPDQPFSAAAVETMLRVNLLGAAYAIEAVLPAMLERGRGQIAGISSLAGYRGLPGSAGYCASKAGLSALLESLRVDLRGRGIVVTTIHPGFVRTPMTEDAGHAQPWIIEPAAAARTILKGLAARRAEVNFPWPTVALMAAVSHMPNLVYDRLAARLIPRRESTPRPDQ